MTSDPGARQVLHRPEEHRFVVEDHAELAELVYDVADGRLVIVHTGVPDRIAGRGIGGQLVEAAVQRAGGEHLTVVPWCPFARRWLRRHPEAWRGVDVAWDDLPS